MSVVLLNLFLQTGTRFEAAVAPLVEGSGSQAWVAKEGNHARDLGLGNTSL